MNKVAARRGLWLAVFMGLLTVYVSATIASAVSMDAPSHSVSTAFALVFRASSITDCNDHVYREVFSARGHEDDHGLASNPRLSGRLTLRQDMVFRNGRWGVGEVDMTARTAEGDLIYVGHGQVVAALDGQGGFAVRGMMTATVYARGAPTSRRIRANIAYRVGDHSVDGGFGAFAADTPSVSATYRDVPCSG
jgi:hypothetical protein